MGSLADRYGTPSPVRRRLLVSAVAVVVAASLGWLAWATWFHSNPVVTSEMPSYDVVDDHRVTAVLEVSVDDGVTASCVVRAYSRDHTTVGELTFEPEPGRNEVTVRTERRATSVTLLGCTAPGQPRPR